MTHKSKFSLEVGEYKSLIYNVWKKPSQRQEFVDIQDKTLKGSRKYEDRIHAFWTAYTQMSVEYGPIDGIEIPKEYQGEAPKEPDDSLDSLLKRSESSDILSDFYWAYGIDPLSASRENAPSAGAWFFLDMKKNNKNKFADLSIRILDKLAAQEDEQKSRKADYTAAMGLLEGAAEKHLSGEKLGNVRESIRRGAERVGEQSTVPAGNN
jgi:hypothetical protein